MPYVYQTSNLDTNTYSQMLRTILYALVPVKKLIEFETKWTVSFYDLANTRSEFFNHVKLQEGQAINTSMPSGVTGLHVVDLYIHDSVNQMKMRENSDRIQHELMHAILFEIYGNEKRPSDNKLIYVHEVHDRNANGQRFKIDFWYRFQNRWQKLQISLIDIRDLISAS